MCRQRPHRAARPGPGSSGVLLQLGHQGLRARGVSLQRRPSAPDRPAAARRPARAWPATRSSRARPPPRAAAAPGPRPRAARSARCGGDRRGQGAPGGSAGRSGLPVAGRPFRGDRRGQPGLGRGREQPSGRAGGRGDHVGGLPVHGRRGAVGVLDVEVVPVVRAHAAPGRCDLADGGLQPGPRVRGGQGVEVDEVGQPGQLAHGEGPPGGARVQPDHVRAVLAVRGEDEVGALHELGVEPPRREAVRVAAEGGERGGGVRVDRLADQPAHARALDLDQLGPRTQPGRQVAAEQPLGDRRPADVPGAHVEHAERPAGGGHRASLGSPVPTPAGRCQPAEVGDTQ